MPQQERRTRREPNPPPWVKSAIAVGGAAGLLALGTIVDHLAKQPIPPPPTGTPRPADDPNRPIPTLASKPPETPRLSDIDVIKNAAMALPTRKSDLDQGFFTITATSQAPNIPEGQKLIEAGKRMSTVINRMRFSGIDEYRDAIKFLDSRTDTSVEPMSNKSSLIFRNVDVNIQGYKNPFELAARVLIHTDAAFSDGHTLALQIIFGAKSLQQALEIYNNVRTDDPAETGRKLQEELRKQPVQIAIAAEAYAEVLLALLHAVAQDERALTLQSPEMRMLRADLARFIKDYNADSNNPGFEAFVKNKLYPSSRNTV